MKRGETSGPTWLVGPPAASSVIGGVSKPEHLATNINEADLKFEPGDLPDLSAISRLSAIYPGRIQTYCSSTRVSDGYVSLKPPLGSGEKPV